VRDEARDQNISDRGARQSLGSALRPRQVVWCAACWAGAFAAGSWAMAVGWWDWPATRVAPAIGVQLQARDPGILTVLWVTGGLKLLLAATALATWSTPGLRRPGAWVLRLSGAALVLWGAAEGLLGGLVAARVITSPEGWGDGSVGWWYAGLWGPCWVLGGLLAWGAGDAAHRLAVAPALPGREGRISMGGPVSGR